MKIVFVFILVISVVWSENPENTATLDKLFSDFMTRDTPLYQCSGFGDGIKYRIPKVPDCSSVPRIKEEAVALTITTFWTAPGDRPIKAQECFSKVEKIEKYKYLWGWEDRRTFEEPSEYISESACREMIKSQRTADGQVLKRLHENYFGTDNKLEPEPVVWKTTTETNKNYYYSYLDITVDEKTNQIRTSSIVQEACAVTSGFCPTQDGVLVWDKNQKAKCRLREGPTSDCIKVKDRITCPELEFLFSNISETTICDELVVGYNEQRVYLASKNQGEITQNSMSASNVRKFLEDDHQKHKRSLQDGFNLDSSNDWNAFHNSMNPTPIRLVTDKEYNAHTSYVYSLVKDGHDFDIQNVINSVCRLRQNDHHLSTFMGEIGHPTAIARMVTGDSAYRAKLSGDVISLWKCEEVYDYYFLPRENCTLEWPVRFHTKHDKISAYVSPISHEIVHYPTLVDCPPPPFYFQMKDDVILLSNSTIIQNIPYLPSLGDSNEAYGLPDLTLKAQGHYTAQELSGADAYQREMGQRGNRMWIERALQKQKLGLRLSSNEQSALDGLSGVTLNPIMDKIWYIVLAINVIAVAVVAGFILMYWKPIKKMLDLIWKLGQRVYINFIGIFMEVNSEANNPPARHNPPHPEFSQKDLDLLRSLKLAGVNQAGPQQLVNARDSHVVLSIPDQHNPLASRALFSQTSMPKLESRLPMPLPSQQLYTVIDNPSVYPIEQLKAITQNR